MRPSRAGCGRADAASAPSTIVGHRDDPRRHRLGARTCATSTRGPYEPELTAFLADSRASRHRSSSTWVRTSGCLRCWPRAAPRQAAGCWPSNRIPTRGARMQHLLTMNGLTNLVTVSNAALSDRSGPAATLFLASDSVLSTLDPSAAPLKNEYAFRTSVDVPVSSLDDWLAASGPAWRDTSDRRDEDRRRGNRRAGPPRDGANAGAAVRR